MRITHRVKKSLSTLLLSIQLFFSFFAPFLVFAPSVRAEASAPQIEQVDSQLTVSDYSGALATYYLHDGQIMAQEHESGGDLELFFGSQSGEDAMAHDVSRLVVKTNQQTFYLTDGQLDGSYDSSDLALSSGDEDYLFNLWQVEAATASTVLAVRQGVTYTFPLNNQVQVRFNQLPENPSVLTIEEVSLSTDLQAQLGAVSSVAYDVRTDMIDGEFSYDLILPKAELDGEIEVKYAESLAELSQAETVTQELDVEEQTVKVNDLDHMTLFIVVKVANLGITLPFDGPDDNTGDVWVYRASAGAVTSLVTDPTNSVPEQWRSEVVSMNAPGLGRSYLGYTGFSWETVASSNLKEISWYKYAADTANDHYLNFYIFKGISTGSVVIVPICSGAGVWEQCSTNAASVRVRYRYLTWSGWKTTERSFSSFSEMMNSEFADWRFYNDPETDSSLTIVSGSSTTSSDLLNYVDGVRFVYQDNSDDVYNFEAEPDLARPTVSLSPVAPILTNQATQTINIEFSEEVNELLASELALSNATVDSFSPIDAQHYQVVLRATADGLVTFKVPSEVAFDNAGFGNEESELYSYMVDKTAPIMTDYALSDYNLNASENSLVLSGNIEDASSNIDSVKYSIWNSTKTTLYANWTNASALDGAYDSQTESTHQVIDVSGYPDDTFILGVRGWDKAGNKASGGDFYFTIDSVAPTATIDGAAPKSLYNGDTNISVHAIDDNYLKTELYKEGESSSFKTYTGAWFGLFWLSDGNYRMVVIDKAGNSSEYSFEIDKTAPAQPTGMRILNHLGMNLGCAGYTNNRSITVDWDDSSDSDFAYFLYDIKDKDGHKTLTSSEYDNTIRDLDGYYKFKVRAVDDAGNISVASDWCGVTLDRVMPSTIFINDFSNQIFNEDINIEGLSTDNHQLKIVYIDYKNLSDNVWVPLFELHDTGFMSSYNWDSWWGPGEDGHYDLRAYALDSAGNLEQTALMTNIIFDRIAPVVEITQPSDGDFVKGTVDIKGYVTDANLSHYNIAIYPAGANVNDFSQRLEQQTVYTSEFLEKTIYSWNTSGYSDAGYQIRLAARDLAGNRELGGASEKVIDVTVDNTAPISTITSPINTGNNSVVITNDWDGTIAGTASDISGVDRVELSIDDGSGPVIATASGDVNWTYTLPTAPSEGTYTISSHAIDKAGNRENTYTVIIVFDKTIPEVALTVDPSDPDGQNNWYLTRPEVTLTATDDQDPVYGTDYIEYQWNSQTGAWTTYAVPFLIPGEGQYILYYRAWDKAGNVSEVGIKNLRFDETELSEGPFNISADPNPTSGDTSVISWEAASDNTGISKYEILWRLDGVQHVKTVAGDVLETEIDRLTAGDWRVIVRAFDGAGHSKEASLTLTVDRTAPAAPLLEITGQRPGEVDLSWDSVADASRYIVYYGLEAGNYLYAASVGNVTDYTVQGLTAGNYFFVVRAVDSSDNQSGNSNEVSILDLAGAVGGTEIAEGFQPAGEVQGVETEATEAEQAQMAKEIAEAGQVKGDSIACTGFNKGLFWLFLFLELAVILLLAKFSQANWLKILAFLALPAIFSYIVASTNLAACYQSNAMTWLAGHYYLPAYLTAMFAKMIEIFFFEE